MTGWKEEHAKRRRDGLNTNSTAESNGVHEECKRNSNRRAEATSKKRKEWQLETRLMTDSGKDADLQDSNAKAKGWTRRMNYIHSKTVNISYHILSSPCRDQGE